MFPGTTNRSEGTCGCSPEPENGTRAHSPNPPFCETVLLFPLEISNLQLCCQPFCRASPIVTHLVHQESVHPCVGIQRNNDGPLMGIKRASGCKCTTSKGHWAGCCCPLRLQLPDVAMGLCPPSSVAPGQGF